MIPFKVQLKSRDSLAEFANQFQVGAVMCLKLYSAAIPKFLVVFYFREGDADVAKEGCIFAADLLKEWSDDIGEVKAV